MKKVVIVAVALLLVCLSVTPVAAKSASGIFFKVDGDLNSSFFGARAKLTVTADSVNNIITLKAKFKKDVLWPYLGPGFPAEQWIKGMYQEGPLGVWEVSADGSSITIYTEESLVSLVPSGDIVGTEREHTYHGTISGNQVTFVIEGESEISPLTGTIKIK